VTVYWVADVGYTDDEAIAKLAMAAALERVRALPFVAAPSVAAPTNSRGALTGARPGDLFAAKKRSPRGQAATPSEQRKER
jgi:hypothetical protein